MSEGLPDDMQGVFLLVAQAAITSAPCPSDAELARAYGSHSPSRARRLLAYFEERGLLVAAHRFPRPARRSPFPISAAKPRPAIRTGLTPVWTSDWRRNRPAENMLKKFLEIGWNLFRAAGFSDAAGIRIPSTSLLQA